MKTNPHDKNRQKFNKSTSALSNWPFKARRKDATQHPIIQSNEPCSNRLGSMWSQQEELIVKGISNHLQCEPREAIRIALYEASLAPHKAHESCYIYAVSGSKEPGHTGRNRAGSVALPKSEKELVLAASKQLGITDKEFIRLAVIWIGYGIRDDSFKLTNTKNVGELTVRREWSKDNQGKASTIQPLLDAQKKGIAKSEAEQDERDKEYEEHKEAIKLLRSGNPGITDEAASLMIRGQLNDDPFEQLIRDEIERLDLNDTEAEILKYESWGLTNEEAIAAVKDAAPAEEMSCEEWDAYADEMGLKALGSKSETRPKPRLTPQPRHPKQTEEQVNQDLKRMIEHEERMKKYTDEQRAKGKYVDEELAAQSEAHEKIYRRRLNMRTFWDEHL